MVIVTGSFTTRPPRSGGFGGCRVTRATEGTASPPACQRPRDAWDRAKPRPPALRLGPEQAPSLGPRLVQHLADGQALFAGDAGHVYELGRDGDDPIAQPR